MYMFEYVFYFTGVKTAYTAGYKIRQKHNIIYVISLKKPN